MIVETIYTTDIFKNTSKILFATLSHGGFWLNNNMSSMLTRIILFSLFLMYYKYASVQHSFCKRAFHRITPGIKSPGYC